MDRITKLSLIVIIIIAGIWGILLLKNPFKKSAPVATASPAASASPRVNNTIINNAPTGTKTAGLSITNATPQLSYGQALNKFRGGNLMQFDPSCHPQPYPNLSVKNGTQIMFDNRSAKAITLAFDNQKIQLKGYNWIVLALRDSDVPHNVLIDCNAGQNYGSLLLQK
jgi:hypothetical protein